MAAQLIASHSAAVEYYRRAMIGEQTFEGRPEVEVAKLCKERRQCVYFLISASFRAMQLATMALFIACAWVRQRVFSMVDRVTLSHAERFFVRSSEVELSQALAHAPSHFWA
jgi:hypothetical protein